MCAFFAQKMDKDLEYNRLIERKESLANSLNINLVKRNIDSNRYEEKGKTGNYEITYYTEGEGSAKNKKHGYFEVARLLISRYSGDNSKAEETISLNYENSEMYTSYRDREFWMEYTGTDLPAIKEKFTPFLDAEGETVKEKVLKEFARYAEKAYKAPGQDSVFYVSLNYPLDNVERLMYQVVANELSKPLGTNIAAPAGKKEAPSHAPHTHSHSQPHTPVSAQPPLKHKEVKPAEEPAKEVKVEETDEGMKLLLQKKYEEAVEYYKTKAKKSPKDPDGWFGLSTCLFLSDDVKKCTLYYNKCIETDPNFDIFGRMLKLSGDDFPNLFKLAERLIIMELHAEAKKYLDYLHDKDISADLKKKVEALLKKNKEASK